MITAINPSTGETLEKYEDTTPDDVMKRLEKAKLAFEDWKKTDFSERGH